ncbi:MAG: acetoin utilization protein AcuC [Anaerolineales bacterium]
MTTNPTDVVFISSPELWQRGHGPEHPLKPERLQRTHELLRTFGIFEWGNLSTLEPRMVRREELSLFHTEDYIQAVESLSRGDSTVEPRRYNFGPGDNPVFEGMYRSEGLKTGSALQAAEAVLSETHRIAFSYSGGLHHAAPDRASGFCVFNDIAVAISWLKPQVDRIFYLDVDVHHGDGVQDGFYEDPSVYTYSIHQDPRTLFPGTGHLHEQGRGRGEGFCANLPLPPGTDSTAYLEAFRKTALPLIRRYDPDILVTQLGVDTHFEDPLAQLSLTTEAHQALYRDMKDLALPWLAFGGGGYNLDVVPRSWALAVAAMADRELPSELPEEYQQKFGGQWLHDGDRTKRIPRMSAGTGSRVRDIVDQFCRAFELD